MKLELHRVGAQHNEVAALRYLPGRPRSVTIVAAHGYSSSKQNLDPLCAFLAGHGFELFSLDFPGHKLGASGGVLRSFDDCLDAMASVVAFAKERSGRAPYVLGHSMGAITSLVTAGSDSSIRGAVAIATGYRRPAALIEMQKTFTTDFRSAYVDGAPLLDLMTQAEPHFDTALAGLEGRPALYVAAVHDAMVKESSVRELFDAAPQPKQFMRIESNHTFAAENARGDVLRWFNELHPRQ